MKIVYGKNIFIVDLKIVDMKVDMKVTHLSIDMKTYS